MPNRLRGGLLFLQIAGDRRFSHWISVLPLGKNSLVLSGNLWKRSVGNRGEIILLDFSKKSLDLVHTVDSSKWTPVHSNGELNRWFLQFQKKECLLIDRVVIAERIPIGRLSDGERKGENEKRSMKINENKEETRTRDAHLQSNRGDRQTAFS